MKFRCFSCLGFFPLAGLPRPCTTCANMLITVSFFVIDDWCRLQRPLDSDWLFSLRLSGFLKMTLEEEEPLLSLSCVTVRAGRKLHKLGQKCLWFLTRNALLQTNLYFLNNKLFKVPLPSSFDRLCKRLLVRIMSFLAKI